MLRRRLMMAQSGSGGGEIEVPNGVYIQDTDGGLWQETAWDGSVTPNGVAVVADECRFVIALSESSSIYVDSDGYSSTMNSTVYSSRSEAIKNYSGSSNTTAMIEAYGNDETEAAGYCRSFTFPNGKKGYLGSAGEWQAAYDNKSAIATCVSKAGGKKIGMNRYWSSARANDVPYQPESEIGPFNLFWTLSWSSGSWSETRAIGSIYLALHARPFSELGEVTGIVEA